MVLQARVDVPVILTGWTHIGGPTIHVVVGLPDTDDRLVRASDAADRDDLDAVIDVLAEDGVRAAPSFVGVAPGEDSVRVVAHGRTWIQVEGSADTRVLTPPSARVWLDTDLPGPLDVVRLRMGAPPTPSSTPAATAATAAVSSATAAEPSSVPSSAPAPAAVPSPAEPPASDLGLATTAAPSPSTPVEPVPAASAATPSPEEAVASGGPRGWLADPALPTPGPTLEPELPQATSPSPPAAPAPSSPAPSAAAAASPYAALPAWGERAPVIAVRPPVEPAQPEPAQPEPAQPVEPAAPPAPGEPAALAESVEPTAPAAPAELAGPAEPAAPVDATAPVAPPAAPAADVDAASTGRSDPSRPRRPEMTTVPGPDGIDVPEHTLRPDERPAPAAPDDVPLSAAVATAPEADEPPDFGLDQLFMGTMQRSEYLAAMASEEEARQQAELAAAEGADAAVSPAVADDADEPVDEVDTDVAPAPLGSAPLASAPLASAGAVEEASGTGAPATPGVVDSPAIQPPPPVPEGGLLISSTPWSSTRADPAPSSPPPSPAPSPRPAASDPVATPGPADVVAEPVSSPTLEPTSVAAPAPTLTPSVVPSHTPHAPPPPVEVTPSVDALPAVPAAAPATPLPVGAPRFYSGRPRDGAPTSATAAAAVASTAAAAVASTAAAAVTPTAAAAPAPAAAAPYVDPDLTDDVDERTHARGALETDPDSGSGPMVLAVRCPQGHPNPPHLALCRVCVTPIDDQVPVMLPRPPLGVLRLSSGDVVTLDRGVLLGRAPKGPPDVVASQRPHVVRVTSPRKDVSRTHLEIAIDGWHVLVRDLQTTNGTTVALPGEAPVLLRGDEQRLIEPGTRISLADEVEVTYEVER